MKKNLAKYGWSLTVDLEGGRIEELSFNGRQVLGTFNRIDGKTGNTHLCVPNFGDEGMKEYGLPFHGPARSSLWKEEFEEEGDLTIIAELEPTEKYNAQIFAAQEFVLLKDSFLHKVTVENGSQEAVPVNIGIHNYWATPSGWEGMKLNGNDVTSLIAKNGSVSLRKSNTLTFPDGRGIKLKVKYLADAMLWSASKDGVFDREYACIEPVFLLDRSDKGVKAKLLKPGSQRFVSQEISVVR